MRKLFAMTLVIESFTFVPIYNLPTNEIVCAAVKTYDGVGEYMMSDFENQESAKLRAKYRAEQNAKNKIAAYVKSYIQKSLTDNEVITITNLIFELSDVDYKMKPFQVGDNAGIVHKAKVKIKINTEKNRRLFKTQCQ